MLYNQIWHNMLCQNECPNDQLCRIAIYVGICVTMPQQNVCHKWTGLLAQYTYRLQLEPGFY